jgi:hypothetical protein
MTRVKFARSFLYANKTMTAFLHEKKKLYFSDVCSCFMYLPQYQYRISVQIMHYFLSIRNNAVVLFAFFVLRPDKL